MTSTTFAESVRHLSDTDLVSLLGQLHLSLNPNPIELLGLITQERIRRHALVCQDLECGFSPVAF